MEVRERGWGSRSTGRAPGQGGCPPSPWERSLPARAPARPALGALPGGSFPFSTVASCRPGPRVGSFPGPSPPPAAGLAREDAGTGQFGRPGQPRGLTAPSPAGRLETERALPGPPAAPWPPSGCPDAPSWGLTSGRRPGLLLGKGSRGGGGVGAGRGRGGPFLPYSPPRAPGGAWVPGPEGRSLGAAEPTAWTGRGGN